MSQALSNVFKLKDIINVKDPAFGAKGDGVTDDTLALQAWANAISISPNSADFEYVSGRVGYLPKGTYLFSAPIDINGAFFGEGRGISILKATTSTAVIKMFFNASLTDTAFSAGGKYYGFTINGNFVSTGDLVSIGVMNFISFSDVSIGRTLGNGLVLRGTQNALFEQVHISDCVGSNVILKNGTSQGQPLGAAGNTFLRCHIDKYGSYGMESQEGAFANLVYSTIYEFNKVTALAPVLLNSATSGSTALSFYDSDLNGDTAGMSGIRITNNCGVSLNNSGIFNSSGSGNHAIEITTSQPSSVLVRVSGNMRFSGFTNQYYLNGGDCLVLDNANYVKQITNLFGTTGAQTQDSRIFYDLQSVISLKRGQIQFPSTQNPSTGANILDDYEEGSFTPAITFGGGATGIAYTFQGGKYVKIGRLVFISAQISLSSKGSSTGTVLITSLPFTSDTTKPGLWTTGDYSGMGLPANTYLVGRITDSAATIELFALDNTGKTVITDAHFTNSSNIVFSATYIANQ